MNRTSLMFLAVLGLGGSLRLAAGDNQTSGPAPQAQNSPQSCCMSMSGKGGMQMGAGQKQMDCPQMRMSGAQTKSGASQMQMPCPLMQSGGAQKRKTGKQGQMPCRQMQMGSAQAQTDSGPMQMGCPRMQNGSGKMQMGGGQMGGMAMRNGMTAFAPLPVEFATDANPMTPAKVELGRMLFFEKRLSVNGRVSCDSCHDLASYGVDHQPTSSGFRNQKGARNSPTVYNAAGYFAQFWDGRAATVEEQAKGPILNPVEMGLPSGSAAVAALKSIPEYEALFGDAFPDTPDPVTFDNVAAALGAFERKLVTPSRWDRFLAGDQDALTVAERAGFHRFMHTGCASCHYGALVGGIAYKKLGDARPYPDTTDQGRFQVTKNSADSMVFKVPSLRNVERTAPYFHNGKIATLDEAVAEMGKYQLGVSLSPAERAQIIAWLKTLTGTLPAEYIAEPKLPRGAGSQ